jgi:hypothetical protein
MTAMMCAVRFDRYGGPVQEPLSGSPGGELRDDRA